MDNKECATLIANFKDELLNGIDNYGNRTTLNDEHRIRLIDLVSNCKNILKDHGYYYERLIQKYESKNFIFNSEAIQSIDYIILIISIYEDSDNIKKRKLLQDADDKLKEAGISFDKEDYTSSINNLNSSF